jgi:hypothetical protein
VSGRRRTARRRGLSNGGDGRAVGAGAREARLRSGCRGGRARGEVRAASGSVAAASDTGWSELAFNPRLRSLRAARWNRGVKKENWWLWFRRGHRRKFCSASFHTWPSNDDEWLTVNRPASTGQEAPVERLGEGN